MTDAEVTDAALAQHVRWTYGDAVQKYLVYIGNYLCDSWPTPHPSPRDEQCAGNTVAQWSERLRPIVAAAVRTARPTLPAEVPPMDDAEIGVITMLNATNHPRGHDNATRCVSQLLAEVRRCRELIRFLTCEEEGAAYAGGYDAGKLAGARGQRVACCEAAVRQANRENHPEAHAVAVKVEETPMITEAD